MTTFEPLHLVAPAPLLRRLESGIVSISVLREPLQAEDAWIVWLRLHDGTIVRVQASDATFSRNFEIFTLSVRPALKIATPSGPAVLVEGPWPLRQWRLEVLQRREWIIRLPDNPSEWPDEEVSPLGPGETPPDATDTCLVSVGLLFEDEAAGGLLIGVGEAPMGLVVMQDAAAIDLYLRPCFRVPVSTYAAALGNGA